MIINEFDSTKNYTALVLSLFDNIQLRKSDTSLYTIPIYFSQKSRLYKHIQSGNTKSYSTRVPAMSLFLSGIESNSGRKTNKFLKRKVIDIDGMNASIIWNDKPMDYLFNLTIIAKNIEEVTNISEAILSTFKDDLYYLDYTSPIQEVISTPIKLSSMEMNIDNNEDDYLDDRLIEANFSFTVEGVIHSQIQTTNGVANQVDCYLETYYNDIENQLDSFTILP